MALKNSFFFIFILKSVKDIDEEPDNKPESLLFESKFSKGESNILDVCSGNLNHINLKQVVYEFYLNKKAF